MDPEMGEPFLAADPQEKLQVGFSVLRAIVPRGAGVGQLLKGAPRASGNFLDDLPRRH